jgi:hypothetical protein
VAKQRLGIQPLKLEEIDSYYKDCEGSLRLYFSEKNPEIQNVLIQYFPTELEEDAKTKLLDIRIKELERSTSLILLSAIEAWFMNDVKQRQVNNLTDALSIDLIKWSEGKSYILLNDRLLDIWKTHDSSLTDLIGTLKDRFQYRHWLAHGRHFPPKTQRHEYPFEKDIYKLAEVVLKSFPFKGL